MKKLFALLLALCLCLSLAGCGGQTQSAAGTWNARLDLKRLVGERLGEILDHLKSTDVSVTLVLHEDKSFHLTVDGTGVAAAVQEAATAYFTGLLDSLGHRVSNIIRTRQNGDLSALLGLSSLTCVSKSASSAPKIIRNLIRFGQRVLPEQDFVQPRQKRRQYLPYCRVF